jgi:hypothetical protein
MFASSLILASTDEAFLKYREISAFSADMFSTVRETTRDAESSSNARNRKCQPIATIYAIGL